MYQAAACIDRSGLYYSDNIQEKQKDAPEAANGLRDVLLLCKRARTLIERGERRPVLPAVKLEAFCFQRRQLCLRRKRLCLQRPSIEAAAPSAAFSRRAPRFPSFKSIPISLFQLKRETPSFFQRSRSGRLELIRPQSFWQEAAVPARKRKIRTTSG